MVNIFQPIRAAMCQRSKSQYMLFFFFLMWSDWFLKMSLLLYCYLLLPVEDVNLHEVNVTRIPSFFFFRKGWQF